MIYEETSGTSPNDIYDAETLVRVFLLLEDGSHFLLETGAFILLEASSNLRTLYEDTSGTSSAEIIDTSSGIGSSLFEDTSGSNPNNPFEEE